MWNNYRLIRTVWQKMATLTEKKRESSLNIMFARMSNTKQMKSLWPDCSAGDIRVKNIESIIVEGWNFIQETYLLTYTHYLVRLFRDDRGKSALFQTLIAFFINIFNTSKYTHMHSKESRVHLYYQRVAGVFWGWVMTARKRPVIPAVHGIHLYMGYTTHPCQPYNMNPTGVHMIIILCTNDSWHT